MFIIDFLVDNLQIITIVALIYLGITLWLKEKLIKRLMIMLFLKNLEDVQREQKAEEEEENK